MANTISLIPVLNTIPASHTGMVGYYIADTTAGKPVTNLEAGDLCWAKDATVLYVAMSATTWDALPTLGGFNDWGGQQLFRGPIDLGDGYTIFGGGGAAATSTTLPITGINSRLVVVGGSQAASPPDATEIGYVNATAKVAAIASTNLTNTTAAGLYRISYFLRCTSLDLTAGTISASFTYSDSVSTNTETTATVALTSTANKVQGSFVVDLASGNITYLTTLVGIIGISQYKLRARCEYLG